MHRAVPPFRSEEYLVMNEISELVDETSELVGEISGLVDEISGLLNENRRSLDADESVPHPRDVEIRRRARGGAHRAAAGRIAPSRERIGAPPGSARPANPG